jgi:hypothetical protein
MTLPILFSKSLLLISISEKKERRDLAKKLTKTKIYLKYVLTLRNFPLLKSDKFKEETEIQNEKQKEF